MKIAIFGGSFDPVHLEHVQLVRTAAEVLQPDKIIVVPAFVPPHKQEKNMAPAHDRLQMAKFAFAGIRNCEVSAYEINAGGTSYTCRTLRHFHQLYPDATLYLLVGADMLQDFYTWREPEEILQLAELVACRRTGVDADFRAEQARFAARFSKPFQVLEFTGRDISSTKARVLCAFGEELHLYLPGEVVDYIEANELYRVECVKEALQYLKPARRKHTVRVAMTAAEVGAKYKVSEHAIILAAGLHDVAKYVAPTAPELAGFAPPDDVPAPVLHQYTGAYMAEHRFGVTDADVLNAVRYHTSGRPEMGMLEKIIFLADMLEPGRDFPGVGKLRRIFARDLDECLYRCLKSELKFLKKAKAAIYPLTVRAYEYYKKKRSRSWIH